MILVDTKVWIGHLRTGDQKLARLLDGFDVATHPFVIGEIALGSVRGRKGFVRMLRDLPQAIVADGDEVLSFIGPHALHGRGIGYVDAHLLAATRLSPGMRLWSREVRLAAAAKAMGLAA